MTSPDGKDRFDGNAFEADRLREVTGGDPGLARELIDLFLTELGERLSAIEAALGQSEFETLCQEAHGLKGSSGNIGAVGILGIARALERDGRLRDRESCLRSFERLKTASHGLRLRLQTEAAPRRAA